MEGYMKNVDPLPLMATLGHTPVKKLYLNK